MKIKIFLFKNLWVLVIFFSMCAQGMLSSHQQLAIDTELHNQNQLIMGLPNEMWVHIFSYCHVEVVEEKQLLHTFFKHCSIVKHVCKYFNSLLASETVVAELCKGHTTENKNKVLQQVTRTITRTNYSKYRSIVLALLYSGASANICNHIKYNTYHFDISYLDFSLLHKALIQNDYDLCIKLLLAFNADPNQLHPNNYPLFFLINNTVLADLFFKKGADFNGKDKDGANVLWYLHKLSPTLIQFYIDHGVDTRYINPVDNTCILHVLANPTFKYIYNSNDFYEKGVLLIKNIPDMVNTLNKKGKTPVDLMKEKTKREFYKHNTFYSKPFRELIAVYRAYEGKTAQELAQEK